MHSRWSVYAWQEQFTAAHHCLLLVVHTTKLAIATLATWAPRATARLKWWQRKSHALPLNLAVHAMYRTAGDHVWVCVRGCSRGLHACIIRSDAPECSEHSKFFTLYTTHSGQEISRIYLIPKFISTVTVSSKSCCIKIWLHIAGALSGLLLGEKKIWYALILLPFISIALSMFPTSVLKCCLLELMTISFQAMYNFNWFCWPK